MRIELDNGNKKVDLEKAMLNNNQTNAGGVEFELCRIYSDAPEVDKGKYKRRRLVNAVR
jgi:hypothetical protein